jgi:hypothetical protein
MTVVRSCLLALRALLLAAPLGAQQPASLALTVTADSTGEPLPSTRVSVGGTGLAALADGAGRLRVGGIPPGRHCVEVRALGYAPVKLDIAFAAGATVEGEVALVAAPIALEGIEATAARGRLYLRGLGFYERQKRGLGTFIDRERLEKRQPFFLSDALRGIRGVRIVRTPDGRHLAITSRGSGSILNANCAMPIYLDGGRAPFDDLDTFPVRNIEAIEVYRGPAETPPRFSGAGSVCGAIVIWTRVGP